MPALFRALIYASLFVGFLFLYLPSRLLEWSGIRRPEILGWAQVSGLALGIAGALLALDCVIAFARFGKGTPAPFDPPRQLVVRGPYRMVRNPMYISAGFMLAAVALYYQSGWVALYAVVLLVCANFFVVLYKEPKLRRTFGDDYEDYCRRVHRWLPGPTR